MYDEAAVLSLHKYSQSYILESFDYINNNIKSFQAKRLILYKNERKLPVLVRTCKICSELPSYMIKMISN